MEFFTDSLDESQSSDLVVEEKAANEQSVSADDVIVVSNYSHDQSNVLVRKGDEEDYKSYFLAPLEDPEGSKSDDELYNWTLKLGRKAIDKSVTISLWKNGFWSSPPYKPNHAQVGKLKRIAAKYEYSLEELIKAIHTN